MGVYLNGSSAYGLFQEAYSLSYYVDKSEIISELVPLIELKKNIMERSGKNRGKGMKYVAVTRPRRFGKTTMANMIASYFGKGVDSHEEFDTLKVSNYPWYKQHLNQHNVIHIMFNEIQDEITDYSSYIMRIKNLLLDDIVMAYPSVKIRDGEAVWDVLRKVYEYCGNEKFIFVLDECDYIYYQDFVTDADKKHFTKFLSNLLKDKSYVEMAYMTGILPIAKYSSGSELNMFCEYTMVTEEKYSEYFGFTEREVDDLFERYLQGTAEPKVTRDGLRFWYDGYHTKSGERVYNPRSVVLALENNNLGNYWTSSGPYDELFTYIEKDVDQMKDYVGLLISGIPVPAKVQEYAATSMELKTRDEIFSAMVVYGFLNYENGCVSIPNKEVMDKFDEMAQKLDYLQARAYYRIEREDRAGTGYVDFIFYPIRKDDDAIIIELKVDHTADEAIQQTKDREYALRFSGKIGEKPEYTGRILAVGIAYNKADPGKRHACKVEVLREK